MIRKAMSAINYLRWAWRMHAHLSPLMRGEPAVIFSRCHFQFRDGAGRYSTPTRNTRHLALNGSVGDLSGFDFRSSASEHDREA